MLHVNVSDVCTDHGVQSLVKSGHGSDSPIKNKKKVGKRPKKFD